jgi:PilZ domain-containing protein
VAPFPVASGCFAHHVMLMNEPRTIPRRSALNTGAINFGVGEIPCTVHNLSDRGALLRVSGSPWGFPDRLELVIDSERVRRPCRVAWRRGQRLGIVFAA